MSRSIEQTLSTLLPTLSYPVPSTLIDLASSLLAQSRPISLKPDEEIARTYACANIACERLKQKLNLPKIEPRPPCPPSIYNKMFTYLETMLSKPPAKVERPQNKALKDSLRLGRSKEQELRSASEHTGRPNNETERASPSLHRSPNTIEPGATLTKRKKGRPSGADEEAAHRDDRSPYSRDTTPKVHSQRQRKPHPTPVQARPNPKPRKLNGVSKQDLDQLRPWVAPTIRHLCFWLKTPAAVPHMLAGVTTILTQPLWLDDGTQKVPEKKDKVPALIIAVYFFVATRLSGKETTGQEYTRQKHEALALMENWEVGRRERGKVVEKDVDAWLKEISAKGWLQREWFQNIKYGGGLEKEEDEEDRLSQSGQDSDGGDQNGREKSSRKRKKHSADQETPVYGLGTMMQESVDYLSESKRFEYEAWRGRLLAKMDAMEKDNERIS